MRRFPLIIAFIGVVSTASVFADTVAPSPKVGSAVPAQAQESTVVLDVDNMTCGSCPITIKKALRAVPGVTDAKTDLDTKTATVRFDPKKTNVEALTRATADAGYPSKPKP